MYLCQRSCHHSWRLQPGTQYSWICWAICSMTIDAESELNLKVARRYASESRCLRRRFTAALLPRLFGNDVQGHTWWKIYCLSIITVDVGCLEPVGALIFSLLACVKYQRAENFKLGKKKSCPLPQAFTFFRTLSWNSSSWLPLFLCWIDTLKLPVHRPGTWGALEEVIALPQAAIRTIFFSWRLFMPSWNESELEKLMTSLIIYILLAVFSWQTQTLQWEGINKSQGESDSSSCSIRFPLCPSWPVPAAPTLLLDNLLANPPRPVA